MEELLRCPFCHGEAIFDFHDERPVHLVMCRQCGNRTEWKETKSEAAAAWNRRPTNEMFSMW